MSDYFICTICEKEFPIALSKDSTPYTTIESGHSTNDGIETSNLCCVGCYFTYVVPFKEDGTKKTKLNINQKKLKLIKGR